ncbi:rRNA maturation RNase YbeY [Acidithiobacillus sp. IBUN Pt1247-S3]|uniref:rRNA maturation RNase YbeY n=1 Tax=Acidithiobacillus sp. IBUN Pt1247-S3 TaxID=3166642 RepID=UPI0034E44E53
MTAPRFILQMQVSPDLSVAELAEIPSRRLMRAALALALTGCTDEGQSLAVSLQFLGGAEIAEINGQFRQRPQPTNCLSFPAPTQAWPGRRRPLGDILLCPAVVAREADEQGKPLRDHYRHLLIHSALHLLGHDHQEEEEAGIMEALETRLLAQLGVADPYRIQSNE